LTAEAKAAAPGADVSALYAAAKKEGTVTWWVSPYVVHVYEQLRDGFKTTYPGIDVQLLRATAQVINQRVAQNLQAGIREVDVFSTSDEGQFLEHKRRDALLPFVPPDAARIVPAFRTLDPDHAYNLGALAFVVLDYNPKKVQPAPSRWTDLLDPKFRGQISTGHPAYSGYVALWALTMIKRYGYDYLTRFAANQPKIGRSIQEVIVDIAIGERNLGPSDASPAYERKANGESIDVRFPDEAVIAISPVAIAKNAPHPNAAKLLVNFHYSRVFGDILARTYNFPLRADMGGPSKLSVNAIKYHRISVQEQIAQFPELVVKWRGTFGV